MGSGLLILIEEKEEDSLFPHTLSTGIPKPAVSSIAVRNLRVQHRLSAYEHRSSNLHNQDLQRTTQSAAQQHVNDVFSTACLPTKLRLTSTRSRSTEPAASSQQHFSTETPCSAPPVCLSNSNTLPSYRHACDKHPAQALHLRLTTADC
ncbi:unnamed protein product, partial [Iphiclides podalirius]